MANEYSIVTTVDSSGAVKGAREFKRSLSDISQSASKIVKQTDYIRAGFKQLGAQAVKTGGAISGDFRKTAQSITNSAARIETQATKSAVALEKFSKSAISSTSYLAREYQKLPSSVGGSLRRLDAETSRAGASFNMLGKAVSAVRGLLIGFAAGFTLQATIGQITTFEASISRIRSLLGKNALESDMAAIEMRARSLGATTVFSGSQAAEAMTELVKAGMNAKQAMAAAGDALNLAAADGLSMAEAASITANILATFSMRADEAGRASDVLAHAANASQTDVRGVGEAMKYVGPVAAALGVTFEDAAAAVGTLSNAGIDASMAGTGLRQIMSGLMTPTKQASEAMASMGMNVGEIKNMLGQEGGLVKMVEAFANAQKKLGNDTEFASRVLTVLGDRGGPALLALVSQLPGMQKLSGEMKNVAGTAKDMAEIMTDNLKGDFAEIESAVEELTLQMGDAGLLGVLRSGAQAFGAFLRGMGGLSEDTDKATRSMNEWNRTGKMLSDNIELIKDGVIVLASVFVGRWLAALTAGAVAAARQIAVNTALAMSWRSVAAGAGSAGVAMNAAALAAGGFRAVVAALGGPVGLLITGITVAAAALYTFSDNAADSSKEASSLRSELDQLATSFHNMGEQARVAAVKRTQALIIETQERRRAISQQLADDEAARIRLKKGVFGNGDMPGTDLGTYQRAKGMKLDDTQILRLQAELEDIDVLSDELPNKLLAMQNGTLGMAESMQVAARAAQTAAVALGETDEKALAAAAKKAQQEFDKLKTSTQQLMDKLNPLVGATLEYKEKLASLTALQNMSAEKLKKLGVTHEDVKVAIDALNDSFEKQKKELDPLAKKYDEVAKKLKETAKQVRPLDALHEEHNKTLNTYYDLLKLTDEELKRVGVTRAEVTQGILDENKAYADNIKQIEKNSKQADPWAKAWESSIERIDGLFADLWTSAFDGFEGFADKVKDTFKQLIGELLNAATTRGLTNLFGKLTGQGGGGSVSSGGGFWNSIMSMFTGGGGQGGGGFWSNLMGMFTGGSGGAGGGGGFWSSILSSFTGGGNSTGMMGNLLSALGFGGSAALPSSYAAMMSGGWAGAYGAGSAALAPGAGVLAPAYGGGTATAAGGAGSAGAGASTALTAVAWVAAIAYGMYMSGEYFKQGWQLDSDSRKDVTNSVDDTGLLPLMTDTRAVFAADDLLQSLGVSAKWAAILSGSSMVVKTFGHQKPKVQSSGFSGELGVGGFEGEAFANIKAKGGWFRSDKKWTEYGAMDQGFTDFVNKATKGVRTLVQDIASESEESVKKAIEAIRIQSGKITLDKDPEKAKEQIEMMIVKIQEEMASKTLQAMNMQFLLKDKDTDLGPVEILALVKTFTDLRKQDPAADASKDFADSQKTGIVRYREELAKLDEQMTGYDGTVAGLMALIDATAALKQAQYDLLIAYQQLAEQAKVMFKDTAQGIRESMMDPEELYTTRQSQIQTLMQQMSTETDPAKLQAMANEINSLVMDAWNMLDEGQREDLMGGFLTFLEEAEALLLDRVGVGMEEVEGDSAALNLQISETLASAAERHNEAADTFSEAVDRFAGIVGGGGGRRNTNPEVEIMAL